MHHGDEQDDLKHFETAEEAFQYLRYVGTLADEDIDLGEAALALALVFLPGIHVDRYRQHFVKLAAHLKEDFEAKQRLKEDDTLHLRLSLLRKIVHDDHGYAGDTETYDDIDNANIIRVIERRRGLPVALGLIYIVLARAMGWAAQGLSFPGHFIIRLEDDHGGRLLADPFASGKELNAADLRALIKEVAGEKAELSHNYYDPLSTRDVLLRLQNNIKKRLIEAEEYAQAIRVIETMEALAPDEPRTLFDKGVLYARLGHNQQAADALRDYIGRISDVREKQQAQALLAQIIALG